MDMNRDYFEEIQLVTLGVIFLDGALWSLSALAELLQQQVSGLRKKNGKDDGTPAAINSDLTRKTFNKNQTCLIQKVYEVDPFKLIQHVVFTKLLTSKCPEHILVSQKIKVLSLRAN